MQPQFNEPVEVEDVDVIDDEGDTDFDVDAEDEIEDTGTDEAPKTDKPAKAKKESTRPPVPEGYVSPVKFASELTAHAEAQGWTDTKGNPITGDNPIKPQIVYSYIKNNTGDGAKHPFPTHPAEGRAFVVKVDEGIEWWTALRERTAASKAAAAEKREKKANAAKTSAQAAAETGEVPTGEVEEAE
jgi:hypothetical protein